MIKSVIRNYLKKRYECFPMLLSIEITNKCNSSCIMCPRKSLTRKIQDMSFDVFKKIIEDCKDKPLKKINLFWFGDPFMNPNIIEYLSFARKELKGVKLYISTNAELLIEKRADSILENSLLDVINFDVDGITKETYESIRVGVDFNKVMKNIHYLINKKKELKTRKPQIRLTIIKMKDTMGEIESFKNYWTNYVDKVDVNDYNTWTGAMADRNIGDKLEKSQKGIFKYPCIHPWNELVISADGLAGLCCLDYDLNAPVGDVKTQSIQEIWKGEKINNYRNILLKLDYYKIKCCKNCNAHIYQDNSFWARMWQ